MKINESGTSHRAWRIMKLMLADNLPIDAAMDRARMQTAFEGGERLTFAEEVEARNRAVYATFVINGEQ